MKIDRVFIGYLDNSARDAAVSKTAGNLVSRGKYVKISEEQLGKYEDVDWQDKDTARNVLEKILEEFLGNSVFFRRGKKAGEAYLTRRGIDHAKGGPASSRKAAAFSVFCDLVTKAEYSYSCKNDPHKKNQPKGRVDWDYFVAVAMFGDTAYPVVFKVRTIDQDVRSQIYEIAAKNETGGFRGDGHQNDLTDAHPSYEVAPISDARVPQNERDVKRFSVRRSQELSPVEREAVRIFGTTTSFEEAGFLMPDGRMLRLSDDAHAGAREYDHRAIGMAYGAKVDLSKNHGFSQDNGRYLDEFVEAGNIRFDAGDPDLGMDIGLQLSATVPLTREQERLIRDLIEWKQERETDFEAHMTEDDFLYSGPLAIRIDFGADSNYAVGSASAKDLSAWGKKSLEYTGGHISAQQIIHDIRHYYETGETTQRSNLSQFRYSFRADSQGRELSEQQAEFFRDSKARDTEGRLLRLYHQTDGDFTIFDTRHPGAGSKDGGTPFGIFLKRNPGDIGLNGKKQMELYANITNPLRAADRADLDGQLRKLSAEYEDIAERHIRLDAEYHDRFEQAKKAWLDYIAEWRKANPGANRRALYDDPGFMELFDAEEAVVEEWTEAADHLNAQAKELITDALRGAGYDGVFLDQDQGSWGRKTDAVIALYPEQVKSVPMKAPAVIRIFGSA